MGQKVVLKDYQIKDYQYEESIKTLRTNLQFSGSAIKAVMLTSAMPDEGKSEMAFSLAFSLSQIGKKVILVDADIRKSVLVSRYQLEKQVSGLSQYLSGQKKLAEVVCQTNVENLDMVFAGPYSPNPAELLEEKLFEDMIEQFRADYDYIIIDTPPMANLIDGAIAARHCDGAIMVIESGAVSYRLEQKVKNQLEKSGCRILGAVINKVDLNRSGYGYYNKYGKYGKYGRYQPYSAYGATSEETKKG